MQNAPKKESKPTQHHNLQAIIAAGWLSLAQNFHLTKFILRAAPAG
jgi:hypothetical protein